MLSIHDILSQHFTQTHLPLSLIFCCLCLSVVFSICSGVRLLLQSSNWWIVLVTVDGDPTTWATGNGDVVPRFGGSVGGQCTDRGASGTVHLNLALSSGKPLLPNQDTVGQHQCITVSLLPVWTYSCEYQKSFQVAPSHSSLPDRGTSSPFWQCRIRQWWHSYSIRLADVTSLDNFPIYSTNYTGFQNCAGVSIYAR